MDLSSQKAVMPARDPLSELRLFVAIWLPPGLARAALKRLDLLRPSSSKVRWVRPDQLHLTLKFLGETPSAALPGIQAALAQVAGCTQPIVLGMAPGGVFPPSGPPRIVWLGLTPGAELGDLATRVERALLPLGFPRENRPFRPHLTLGRAQPGAVFDRELLAEPLQAGPERVNSLSLVQSELRPEGAVYRNVSEWPFGG